MSLPNVRDYVFIAYATICRKGVTSQSDTVAISYKPLPKPTQGRISGA